MENQNVSQGGKVLLLGESTFCSGHQPFQNFTPQADMCCVPMFLGIYQISLNSLAFNFHIPRV